MALADRDARLRFLESSARRYAITAPETSAHLILQRNGEVAEYEVKARESLVPACLACGTILIPGRNSTTTIMSTKPARKRKLGKNALKFELKEKEMEKFTLVECLACHRRVKTRLKMSRRPSRTDRATAMVATNEPSIATSKAAPYNDAQKSAGVKSGSKQRAKARKGGLQAMLEKSKQNSISSLGSGLDLMDFMKQG